MLKSLLQELRLQHQMDRNWQENCLRPDYRVEFRYLLRRHLWVLLLTTLTALSLAVSYLLFAPTLYTAHVQVLLDPRIPTALPTARSEDRIVKEFDNPEIETQVEILQSLHIRQAVVKKLKLYDNPEFIDGTGGPIRNLIGTLIDYFFSLTGATSTATDPQAPSSGPDLDDLRTASDHLWAQLDIERVKLSYVLDISFTSLDPNTAAQVANFLADSYIEDQLTTSSAIASQGSKWLEERIDQLRRKVNEAAFKLQEFRAKRSDTGSEQTTVDELESTASAYRKLYESYLQAYIDSAQRQALPSGIARIVNHAIPPVKPSYPRKGRILLGALVLGLLAGYGIAVIRNLFDKTIRGPRQIEKAGIACLGEIRGLNRDQHIRLATDEPLSQFSYDVRRLERNLTAKKVKPFRSVGVTSVNPVFSASEVSCNLAYSYALTEKSVLLVDANLPSPALTRAFGASAHKGLADVLQESAEAEACIIADAFHHVDLLPSGAMEAPLQTAWPFAPGRLGNRLKSVLELYDVVVFDLPAAFSPATLSVAQLVEAVVLVTQSGHTQVPFVTEFASAAESGTEKFVGVAVAINR